LVFCPIAQTSKTGKSVEPLRYLDDQFYWGVIFRCGKMERCSSVNSTTFTKPAGLLGLSAGRVVTQSTFEFGRTDA
jgi:hypothetical protein